MLTISEGQFDTLADTGHKFYGFMDLYLSRVGGGTGRTGLQDVAVKLKLQPRDKWTFKADFHHFMTSTNIGGNVALANAAGYNTVGGNRRLDNDLGSELDLTLVHKYNANTKIVFGYSNYWATQTFAAVNGAAAASGFDAASWGYMMMDVKF
ncbi:MAG: alginate export family protein [Nitrospinae bacterium]|nr:alginate export family protein [Nitrospinota bacterium]